MAPPARTWGGGGGGGGGGASRDDGPCRDGESVGGKGARGGRAETAERGAPARIVAEQGEKNLAEGPDLTITRQSRGVELRSRVEGQVPVERTFPGLFWHAKLPRLNIRPLERFVAVVKM